MTRGHIQLLNAGKRQGAALYISANLPNERLAKRALSKAASLFQLPILLPAPKPRRAEWTWLSPKRVTFCQGNTPTTDTSGSPTTKNRKQFPFRTIHHDTFRDAFGVMHARKSPVDLERTKPLLGQWLTRPKLFHLYSSRSYIR